MLAAVIGVAVGLGAAAQAVTGIGFSLVCVPLLSLALGGSDAVRLANTLAIVVNLLMLARERREAVAARSEARQLVVLLAPAAVVIPLTTLAIRHVNVRVLTIVSALLVLVAVGALARGLRLRALHGTPGALGAGALSSAMNVAGGVGGPAVAGYVINAGWPPYVARPLLAAYFLVLNIASVAARGVPSERPAMWVALGVALVVGLVVGALLGRRLDHEAVRRGTLAVAALGAVAALVRALV